MRSAGAAASTSGLATRPITAWVGNTTTSSSATISRCLFARPGRSLRCGTDRPALNNCIRSFTRSGRLKSLHGSFDVYFPAHWDIPSLLLYRKDFRLSTFPRISLRYSFVCIAVFVVVVNVAPTFSQDAADRIFFNAKVFTGEPQNPYATAVAIHGDKIVAVGNLLEVAKAVAANAERIDMQGKSLFPGFIDSHSHSIDGGTNRISADASENVKTMNQLVVFTANAKKSGKGMNGDILEIFGLPLEFWSHTDQLNSNFSAGAYANVPVVLFDMDGHTAWANSAMLKRATIDSAYVKKLSEGERSYYGVAKNLEPNGFLVDAGMEKLTPLLPKPSDEKLLAAGRAALAYNYSLGITALPDPLSGEDLLKA